MSPQNSVCMRVCVCVFACVCLHVCVCLQYSVWCSTDVRCFLSQLLEVAQKKSQQLETRYKAEICELKERLSQEESAVVALREEMLSKEQHLKKLRQSFKEVHLTSYVYVVDFSCMLLCVQVMLPLSVMVWIKFLQSHYNDFVQNVSSKWSVSVY